VCVVPGHEVSVEGLCIAALQLLSFLPLLVYAPASVVRRAISWLLRLLLLQVGVSVAPRTARVLRVCVFRSFLLMMLHCDLAC
jgi:hypothetical protein